jgi:hypothetical protein
LQRRRAQRHQHQPLEQVRAPGPHGACAALAK